MKIFNSIQWRLQIWYGLILVAVLAGFGLIAYRLEYGLQMQRIDGELQRRFKLLADSLHGPQSMSGRPRFRGPLGPPTDNLPQAHDGKFELPPWAAALFGADQPGGFYFVIERDGKEVARAGDVPALEASQTAPRSGVNAAPPLQDPRREMRSLKPPPAYNQNRFREMWDITPDGESIRVGCSIAQEVKDLRRVALALCGVGGIILLLGLTVGAWLVARAIRPIKSISDAAEKIAAGDLSQRISVSEAESELGKLTAVLNATFARLEAAFHQQKQFASDAAHELRTPVSVILTQAQTALNREREAKEYRETIEACQRAAQRMKRLIAALLELTRLDAGQEHVKRKRFSLAEIVHESVEMIRPIAEERGLKLVSELAPVELTGDAGRLAQVVTNLLTNAIQYNRPSGTISVKLEAQPGLAVLTVADTGQGIASEDLPHIFKRFYRGDKSRTGASNAGLGLAICKAITEAHSGTIEVKSEEDAGTTFTIRLPMSKPEAAHTE